MVQTKQTITIFDFDGTITTKDTYLFFLFHCFGKFNTYLGLFYLSPVILLYKLKLMSNDYAKEITFSYFFKNINKEHYLEKCNSFKYEISKMLKPEAIDKILYHNSQNHLLIIVSASMEDWIRPWALENHFSLIIGTKPQVIGNKLTGKFLSKNCYGQEKVNRLKKEVAELDTKILHVYGDSSGDKQMLELADYSYYRTF